MPTVLSLNSIRLDGGTQPRAAIYQNVIDDYAEAFKAGATFPPIVTFFDGTAYWLADGFHRHAGAKKARLNGIDADIRQGTRRDAVLFSVGANASHGLRRTAEDKQRAVRTLLTDDEWKKFPIRKIARLCAVDEGTVRNHIKKLSAEIPQIEKPAVREVERNGTTYLQNTTNIGGGSAPETPEIRPSSEAPALDNGAVLEELGLTKFAAHLQPFLDDIGFDKTLVISVGNNLPVGADEWIEGEITCWVWRDEANAGFFHVAAWDQGQHLNDNRVFGMRRPVHGSLMPVVANDALCGRWHAARFTTVELGVGAVIREFALIPA